MNVSLLHHVSVCVTDVDRAKRFYGGVLGLVELRRPAMSFGGAWYAVGAAQQLHLIQHEAPRTLRGTTAIDGRDGHLALRVDSYDAALAHLKAHGIACVEAPVNLTPWAQIYVTDPDGNVVELNADRDPDAARPDPGNAGGGVQ